MCRVCIACCQRSEFAKSHHFDVLQRTALPVKRDVLIDPREHIAPSSFNGTGHLSQVGASIIGGAALLTSNSAASNSSSRGRLPLPVEHSFASSNVAAATDKYAHLRRAPVAKDFANTAEPLAHLQVMESKLPSWVEYDRQVLRFGGYFKEAVHASSSENFRVRPILLYFYLEDDSLHIAEPTVSNSGLPQGVFVKRHRVPRDELGRTYEVQDLYVGAELPIYGRVFRLTSADQFTRDFYEKNGAPLQEDELTPQDPFSKKATSHPHTFKKLMNPMTAHQEAALGKHRHAGIQQTQQFLKNDGKVLRFYATWHDEKLYGEKRPYILHFFLADDTVEVLEISQPNSGHGSFPALLKRSKLPIDHTLVLRDVAHVGGNIVTDDPQLQFYSDRHLRVGETINVYGRDLLLCGVDAFTKAYYQRTYGLPDSAFESINMTDPVDEAPRVPVPPHTGFGTEEDSLGSFLFLIPKAPKTDQKKLHELDGVLLRFSAKLSRSSRVDKERKFIMTYYMANDTLQVFELFERNTGHIAGKFLDRCRSMNARTGEYFQPSDLFVGGRVELNKTEFVILDADEFTKKFQADNPAVWNQRKANLNDYQAALAANGGIPFDTRTSTASNTLPDRRPF